MYLVTSLVTFINSVNQSSIKPFWMVPTYDCLEDRCIHDITNHNLLPYCIKQIDSMLLCACTEKRHRWNKNVGRTSMTYSASPHCHFVVLSSFWYHLWSTGKHFKLCNTFFIVLWHIGMLMICHCLISGMFKLAMKEQ